MGNDGGTIPTRREILNLDSINKTSRESLKLKTNAQIELNYKFCKINPSSVLKPPIVSDYQGNLMNKENFLKFLIDKKIGIINNDLINELWYLNSINDIVDLNSNLIKMIETIGKEQDFNNLKIVYLVPCGCCLDKKLIDELIKVENKKFKNNNNKEEEEINEFFGKKFLCPNCNNETLIRDVIQINPTNDNELKLLETRLQILKKLGLYHNLTKFKKKIKKEKKKRKQINEDEQDGNDGKNNCLLKKQKKSI